MSDQQEEGLLEKIQALVAPPQSNKQKGRKTRQLLPPPAPSTQKHGSIENNPFCNACGDGGNLLCCDNCPASFHFYCCDPPVDPKNLPSGEWLCRTCASVAPSHPTPPLFTPLLEQATAANPLIFNIPEELKSHDLLPGQSKKHLGLHAKMEEKETLKFCFACNQRVRLSDLAQCDFCPLHFHLSCVDPPLTTPPSTAWMCPLHPHHSIPDFKHPRLSCRLRAMEKGCEEIQHHHVKLDFLTRINRVPHYRRVTRHLKRRVAQVPPALKTLYSDPMPEACETPPLSESLVCAVEECQWWRGEEERRRRELASLTSSSTSKLLHPSHDIDEWTRRTVLSQVDQQSVNTPPPPSPAPHPPPSTSSPPTITAAHHCNSHESISRNSFCDDSAVFIAATQLLELSKRQNLVLNGVVKPRDFYRAQTRGGCSHSDGMFNGEREGDGLEERSQLRSTAREEMSEREMEGDGEEGVVGGTVNGCSECVREEGEGEDGRQGNSAVEKMDVEGDGGVENGEVVAGVDGDSVMGEGGGGGRGGMNSELEDTRTVTSEEVVEDVFAPDVSLLDPRLVQLLASQRLQQLFRGGNDENKTGSSPSQSNKLLLTKSINGVRSIFSTKPAKPVLTADGLKSAQSVLCPVSGIGTVFAVHKQVTLIGTGSAVDVCLSHYGHCNYLSPRHACIFYNKVTGEYELLNYSDHGSVVDGVLYSCDFSDKVTVDVHKKETTPTIPPLHGHSLEADKAKMKIETARKTLRDQTAARRALEGALSLSRHSGKEESMGEGTRRTTYNSSVVSIPLILSRTKKLSAGVPAATSPTQECKTSSGSSNSAPETDPQRAILCPGPPSTPCQCRRSASCLVGTNRKGWEGTATLYHGSRLRFGCLQFVFSVAGRPGHAELLDALSPLLLMSQHT